MNSNEWDEMSLDERTSVCEACIVGKIVNDCVDVIILKDENERLKEEVRKLNLRMIYILRNKTIRDHFKQRISIGVAKSTPFIKKIINAYDNAEEKVVEEMRALLKSGVYT